MVEYITPQRLKSIFLSKIFFKEMKQNETRNLYHTDASRTVKNAAEIFEAYLTNDSVSGDDRVKQLYAFDGYGRLDTV